MARSLEDDVKFGRPDGFIANMLLFLVAVAVVIFYLSPWSPQPSPLLADAFQANPALNGLILAVLVIGIIYNLRQAGVVTPAARWMNALIKRRLSDRQYDYPPSLLRAMGRLLGRPTKRGTTRISPEASSAILDSIGTRMDEGREMGRYIMNLLVFLGLLGTFWGLLETVNAVANTINGLATTSGSAEDAVSQLITNLREPLSGMGTAFSSSLFGLGGSLIVGFLDLQAGKAQNVFYTDLEEWLADNTDATIASNAAAATYSGEATDLISAVQALETALAANTETQIKAHAGQTAELKDEIRALNRTLIRFGGGE